MFRIGVSPRLPARLACPGLRRLDPGPFGRRCALERAAGSSGWVYGLAFLVWVGCLSAAVAETVVQAPRQELTSPRPSGEPPPLGERTEAQIEAEVDQHVERAGAAFASQRYAESVLELQAAYALSQQPIFLFNIAQSYRRGLRLEEALSMYRRFLAADPKTSLKAEAMGYINELLEVLRRQEEAARERRKPIWKKGWFWGTLAASVVATGTALGAGLGIGLRDDSTFIVLK